MPVAASVFSAWGMLMSDIRHDFIQTLVVRGRLFHEEGADGQHHGGDDTEHGEGLTPRTDGLGGTHLEDLAHQEAAEAEAHQQHTGDQALLIGKPAADGAHHRVVGKAGGEAADDAEADIQPHEGRDAGGQHKAAQEHGCRRPDVDLGADLAGQKAARHAAHAEQRHDDGEGQAQLRVRPLGIFLGDRAGQHAPGVDHTGEQ